jgi:RNA polymerase sigma-70 factor (ECF subfamily)
MVRYQQSDQAATGLLIAQLSPQFFRFFLGQVRDRAKAEDLLQDFWLRIHAARHTYRPPGPGLPWLYAIARRVGVDQYRKARRVNAHELQVETLPEPAIPEEREQSDIDFPSLLETLPSSQRDVILMLKVSGLSLEEVARATKSSIGSVKQKAHRAYTKLRALLEQQMRDAGRSDDAV